MKPKKVGRIQVVDAETGKVVEEWGNALTVLPPRGDVCVECAVDHAWDQPHNQQSLYYQVQFHSKTGRWPSWTDAMEHCPGPVRAAWRKQLRQTMSEKGLPIPPDLVDEAASGD
jgi:hypothetical protein